jgi:protein-disulfide isomerase
MRQNRLAVLGLVLAALLAAAPVPTAGEQSAPQPPVVIDTKDAPALGPENAPVTIVEFGDFQCTFCAQGARGLRRLMTMYPGQVRWVFKHYPLQLVHRRAALAHEAAIAAQEQGKFWEMHELIMANQTRVSHTDLYGYAEQIGLDMAAFKEALETRKYRPRVIRDMQEARGLRVAVTPTYFVNGTRYIGGRSANGFRLIVEPIIRGAAAAPARAADGPPAPGEAPGASGALPRRVGADGQAPPAAPEASPDRPATR